MPSGFETGEMTSIASIDTGATSTLVYVLVVPMVPFRVSGVSNHDDMLDEMAQMPSITLGSCTSVKKFAITECA